jgi:hypothetical protein
MLYFRRNHTLVSEEMFMSAITGPVNGDEFRSAIELLHELIPEDQIELFSIQHSPATVYTALVTLWMLTLQRLGGGMSLESIVRETLTNYRDIFPDNRRVREGTLSKNSSAFSEARHRLSIEHVEQFMDAVAQSIIDRCPHSLRKRRAFIIDGTTFKLPPTSELAEVYPPATNQFGETVWPILMLTVAHELHSGAALRPEFGAMYGDKNTSEAKQAIAIAERIPAGSLILADAGYGIFNVVYGMLERGHDILFRLSKSRFKSLTRGAEPIETTETSRRHQIVWTPSAKDRKTNPALPEDAQVTVEVLAFQLEGGDSLYLVTNMSLDAEQALELYGHRYDVEHDIRDLKVTLGIDNLRARSDEMVRKEMLCSMVAYNLVVQLRRAAAKVANVPPRRLSFTACWCTMQSCLLRLPPRTDTTTWNDRYLQAILMASTDKLPQRKGRSYPRKAHPKRAKSTKFMKKNNPPPLVTK